MTGTAARGRWWRRRRAHARRQAVFTDIFTSGSWGSDESVSGPGSTLEQTAAVRAALPGLLARLGVTSLVDVPCGDWHWLQHVDLGGVDYVGLDLVPALIEHNQETFGGPGRRFATLDVVAAVPPRGDLVLSRDLLVHLSDADVRSALANIRASGARWMLTTTFTGDHPNHDIATGSWRPLNLVRPPWHFPPPQELIVEHCTVDGGIWADKSLGLWELAGLPIG